jgi:prepilin peptidase CpaA
MTFSDLGLILFTAGSFGFDAAKQKIPNGLVLVGVVFAAALHSLAPDGGGWFVPWVGALAGIACALPLYVCGAVAAGDAKWFAAAGAFVGPFGAATLVVGAVLAGGAAAACTSALSASFRRRCAEFAAGWYVRSGWRKWKAPAGAGTRFPFMLCAGPVAIGYALWG